AAQKGSGHGQRQQVRSRKHGAAVKEESVSEKTARACRNEGVVVLVFRRRPAVRASAGPRLHLRSEFTVAPIENERIEFKLDGFSVNLQSEAILQESAEHRLKLQLRGRLLRLGFDGICRLVPPVRAADQGE